MIDLVEAQQIVLECCREVGKIQLTHFRQKNLRISSKSSPSDLVTEVDKKSEEYIINRLLQQYPSHSILAEESGAQGKDPQHLWTIDPLDGTNNYAHGIPIFAISIAYAFAGVTQLGVVYAPYIDETYSAILGKGAYYNHQKITVSAKQTLDTSIVATGFPYQRNEVFQLNLDCLMAIAPKVAGLRRLGAAAYDLSLVAAGRLDAFWELNLSPWDVAAGELIVREAQGSIISLPVTGPQKPSIIAANSTLASAIQQTFNDKMPKSR